jgi:hypothetical protein
MLVRGMNEPDYSNLGLHCQHYCVRSVFLRFKIRQERPPLADISALTLKHELKEANSSNAHESHPPQPKPDSETPNLPQEPDCTTSPHANTSNRPKKRGRWGETQWTGADLDYYHTYTAGHRQALGQPAHTNAFEDYDSNAIATATATATAYLPCAAQADNPEFMKTDF